MKIAKCFLFIFSAIAAANVAFGQQGKWKQLKTKNDLPARSECGLAATNNKLYLIGGDGGDDVECFDPQTLTWNKMAKMPVGMNHFQAVGYRDKVYVLEAFSGGGFPDQTPMSNVYIFDTKKNEWQKAVEIPAERRRAGAGAAEYNGKIYLVAGIVHGHSSGTNNMFDEYDPQTNTWTKLPDAPHIRDHCSATVINDKLYVVGGRNTSYHEAGNFMSFFSKTMLDVDCYDFKSGKWSTLSAKLPLGTGGGAVVNLNNKLYYMGGERATETENNKPRKDVFFLDPALQNQWQAIDTLHDARNGMAAAVLNNTIYIAGGAGGGQGGPPPPNGPNGMPPMPFGRPDTTMHNLPPPGNPPNQQGHGSIAIEVYREK